MLCVVHDTLELSCTGTMSLPNLYMRELTMSSASGKQVYPHDFTGGKLSFISHGQPCVYGTNIMPSHVTIKDMKIGAFLLICGSVICTCVCFLLKNTLLPSTVVQK